MGTATYPQFNPSTLKASYDSGTSKAQVLDGTCARMEGAPPIYYDVTASGISYCAEATSSGNGSYTMKNRGNCLWWSDHGYEPYALLEITSSGWFLIKILVPRTGGGYAKTFASWKKPFVIAGDTLSNMTGCGVGNCHCTTSPPDVFNFISHGYDGTLTYTV